MLSSSEYQYFESEIGGHHSYLAPTVLKALGSRRWPESERRVFELGCGNGSFADILRDHGYTVTAVDTSSSGIAVAKKNYPGIAFSTASAYDALAEMFGQFGAVVSLEVIEHLFEPRRFAKAVFDLLEPDGVAVISTPYHGYLKNVALAVAGRMDTHYSALWDHGHIKFWSIATLGSLLTEAGFDDISFHRVGRIPALAKSMIAVARRP